MDDFKDYPVSITEAEANKTEKSGQVWTVKDCLIYVLKKIDDGEINPTSIAIILAEHKDDKLIMHYAQRTNNILELLGMHAKALKELDI